MRETKPNMTPEETHGGVFCMETESCTYYAGHPYPLHNDGSLSSPEVRAAKASAWASRPVVEPEQPKCCCAAGTSRGGEHAGFCPCRKRHTTTNMTTECRTCGTCHECQAFGAGVERARIERIMEAKTDPWHDKHPGWHAVTQILAAIRDNTETKND